MTTEKAEENVKNEKMLKNMAMTFSLESTTGDIQDLLQRKMNFSIKVLKELNGVILSLATSKDSSFKKVLLKDSKIMDFINEAYEDYKIVVGCTNILLKELMEKKQYTVNEYNTNDEG